MSGVRILLQFTCDCVDLAETQLARMAEQCRRSQREPGCIQFEVFRNVLRPEQYVVLEHWASEDALEAHQQAHLPTRTPLPDGITRVREIYQHSES